jgi:effector-binding domain-containing protein
VADYSIQQRAGVPFAAIRESATMSTLAEVMIPLIDEVAQWLAGRGLAPAGPPFWRYLVIDMDHELVVEVGFPLAAEVDGDGGGNGGGRVSAGVLPAGRYATVIHQGHPDELKGATGELLAWAEGQGLTFDKTDVDGAEHWVCRLENYLSDPAEEPDVTQWRTELAFKLV